MDQETEKIIKEQYKLLPTDVKRALKLLPLSEIMEEITREIGLHIDQAGDLYTETLLVLLGVEQIKDFEKNIQDNLHIDKSSAQAVAQNVNDKVFIAIRESLKEMQPVEEVADTDSQVLDKESILAEIENPTPTIHPISIADQTIPGPAKPKEIVNLPMIKEATGNTDKDIVASEFIAGKLTETVSLPSKKENVSQKYAADPYREPIG